MPKKIKEKAELNWIERKPNTAQFIINSILAILTLATLITTVIFSNRGIKEGQKQYILASNQLILAQKQFNQSIKQRIIDSTINAAKEKRNLLKETADSILAANKYLTQERRNTAQELINKKQLEAIQIQAKTAKQQYESQIATNNMIKNQDRPIFQLGGWSYDSLKNHASFTMKNLGKRPAKFISSATAFLSENRRVFNTNLDIISKSDFNGLGDVILRLPLTKSEFDQSKAIYYMCIIYTDPAYDTPQKFVKYFYIENRIDKTVAWSDISNEEVALVKAVAKIRQFNVEDR